jgi:Tfp pilus assembly PilM family ATPase/Tfp pilus assembly protein PilN
MPKHILGIACGTQQLTCVQITGTAKAYSVTAAVHQPFPHHPDPQEQAALQCQTLQELVDTYHLRSDTIVTTLPAHKAVLRNLVLPFKDPRRIRPTIKYAMEEHMPFEPDDVVADFQLLPSLHGQQTRALVAAVPQQVVADHLSLLQAVGLEPTVVDLDVFALANATRLGCETLGANTVLMDLNPERMLLTLLSQDIPVFARSLVHSLSASDTFLSTSIDRLSKQLQHTLYACENALQQSYEPDVVLLSGEGGTHLGELAAALEKDLGLPVRVWQITSESYKVGKVSLPPNEQARYAVAFGAAIQSVHRPAVGLNLRRERFALRRDIEELRGRLVGLGIMLVCVAGLGLFSLYLNTSYKTQRYAQLQREIAQVFNDTLPGTRMVQPVGQVREKMRELDNRLRAFGGVTGAQLSGLQILREISARIPPSIIVDIDTLTTTTETSELSGITTSYDDVVKLKATLEASPFFPSVKINNTKSEVDNKVSFKLTLTTVKTLDTTP